MNSKSGPARADVLWMCCPQHSQATHVFRQHIGNTSKAQPAYAELKLPIARCVVGNTYVLHRARTHARRSRESLWATHQVLPIRGLKEHGPSADQLPLLRTALKARTGNRSAYPGNRR